MKSFKIASFNTNKITVAFEQESKIKILIFNTHDRQSGLQVALCVCLVKRKGTSKGTDYFEVIKDPDARQGNFLGSSTS